MEKIKIPVTTTPPEKAYHTKRPHRKTRTGCRNCKARKVKCDEGRPVCRACATRKETCVYVRLPQRRDRESSTALSVSSKSPSSDLSVLHEPLFIPAGRDALDMRLLWFYSLATYSSFSTGSLTERNVDMILKVNVVQHAFANPFLMDCLLGLSAMHINHLKLRHLNVSPGKEIYYRAKAFETFRKAVEAADPASFPALLACSLLLCGLSTHMFRGEDAKPLAILDWMIIWRGIGTIVEVTKLPLLFRSGIAGLLFRPNVDLDASARRVPGYLLFMVASTKDDDPEFPLVETYYCALKYLGSLYLELSNGFSNMLLLRIATYFTFLPHQFVEAARQRQPRALVILAHYLAFSKFRVETCWWMDGIGEQEIPNIYQHLGPEWEHLLRVPTMSLLLPSDKDVARLLLNDPSWEPPINVEGRCVTSACEQELVLRAATQAEETDQAIGTYQQNLQYEA